MGAADRRAHPTRAQGPSPLPSSATSTIIASPLATTGRGHARGRRRARRGGARAQPRRAPSSAAPGAAQRRVLCGRQRCFTGRARGRVGALGAGAPALPSFADATSPYRACLSQDDKASSLAATAAASGTYAAGGDQRTVLRSQRSCRNEHRSVLAAADTVANNRLHTTRRSHSLHTCRRRWSVYRRVSRGSEHGSVIDAAGERHTRVRIRTLMPAGPGDCSRSRPGLSSRANRQSLTAASARA